jgi:hypothetical protein
MTRKDMKGSSGVHAGILFDSFVGVCEESYGEVRRM